MILNPNERIWIIPDCKHPNMKIEFVFQPFSSISVSLFCFRRFLTYISSVYMKRFILYKWRLLIGYVKYLSTSSNSFEKNPTIDDCASHLKVVNSLNIWECMEWDLFSQADSPFVLVHSHIWAGGVCSAHRFVLWFILGKSFDFFCLARLCALGLSCVMISTENSDFL